MFKLLMALWQSSVTMILDHFTSGNAFSVDENETAVGNVVATDADGDTLAYSLSGSDAASLNVDSNGL